MSSNKTLFNNLNGYFPGLYLQIPDEEDMAEEIKTSITGGQKGVKPQRYDLIPVEPLEEVATLYGVGAKKYEENNWRKGYEFSKSYSAMQRHANAFWNGEDLDPEMGTPHLASVIFHAMALLEFSQSKNKEKYKDFDDRYGRIKGE